MGDQLDELLASLTASCRVYLLSSLYCILLIARQINIIDWLIEWLIGAFYGIRPENGSGLFNSSRGLHGAPLNIGNIIGLWTQK